jgi:uncharacterized Zn finger protein (UPF0148 family)
MKVGDKVTIVLETPDGLEEKKSKVESILGEKVFIEAFASPFNKSNGEYSLNSAERRMYIKEIKGVMGNSKEAIVGADFSLATSKERAIEMLTKMTQSLINGDGNIKPFILASKDGNILCQECEVDEDGLIKLPEIKVNSKRDIETKSKFVRKILKEINPVLKAEIENVTYVALMRKDAKKLEGMMRALRDKKKNTKIKVENRAGCIWLIIDEFEVVL